jgi:hypothetical protein
MWNSYQIPDLDRDSVEGNGQCEGRGLLVCMRRAMSKIEVPFRISLVVFRRVLVACILNAVRYKQTVK